MPNNYFPKQNQPVVVEVFPSGRPGHFDAYVDGQQLVVGSRQPFLDSCRVLLKLGAMPQARAVMKHADQDIAALRSTIGAAAGLVVDEHPRPRFKRALAWDTAPSVARKVVGDMPKPTAHPALREAKNA